MAGRQISVKMTSGIIRMIPLVEYVARLQVKLDDLATRLEIGSTAIADAKERGNKRVENEAWEDAWLALLVRYERIEAEIKRVTNDETQETETNPAGKADG